MTLASPTRSSIAASKCETSYAHWMRDKLRRTFHFEPAVRPVRRLILSLRLRHVLVQTLDSLHELIAAIHTLRRVHRPVVPDARQVMSRVGCMILSPRPLPGEHSHRTQSPVQLLFVRCRRSLPGHPLVPRLGDDGSDSQQHIARQTDRQYGGDAPLSANGLSLVYACINLLRWVGSSYVGKVDPAQRKRLIFAVQTRSANIKVRHCAGQHVHCQRKVQDRSVLGIRGNCQLPALGLHRDPRDLAVHSRHRSTDRAILKIRHRQLAQCPSSSPHSLLYQGLFDDLLFLL